MHSIARGPRTSVTSSVVPFVASRPKDIAREVSWIYDVQPSHSLPTLDLARTLQSEFCSPRVNSLLRAIRRQRLLLMLAYVVTTLSYFVSLLVPTTAGGYVALIGAIVGLPGVFVVLGQMRYDIMMLLIYSFDVWFSSGTWLFVFIVLAMMLQNLRSAIVVSFWLGSWPNTCHDAVIVTIRPIVLFNVVCIFISVFIVVGVNCNSIDRLRNFNVLEYGGKFLPARAAVTDGFGTVAAIMIRNVYRRRTVFQRHNRSKDLECVIYRCHLQLVQRCHSPHESNAQQHRPIPHGPTEVTGSHIQTMRFAPDIASVDARNTFVPAAFSFLTAHPTVFGLVWPALACLATVLTLTSMITMVFTDKVTTLQFASVIIASALTAMNSVLALLLYQRQLIRLMGTTFDSIFLLVQLVNLHISSCDLFEWTPTAVLLATLSWQWITWALLLDAFTPHVKNTLRIHRHFPSFIYACGVGAVCLLVYVMVFAGNPAKTTDRVIWEGTVMGHTVTFRVLPQFYSSLSVVFVLMMRYCWRQLWSCSNDLVIIDGAVGFTNSFVRSRMPRTHITPGPPRGDHVAQH